MPPVVITTINQPTEAVRVLNARDDLDLIVVGDSKTPADWALDGVTYYSIEQQRRLSRFGAECPERSYARKNFGYLMAMRAGSPTILETDDDNEPYDSFGANLSETLEAQPVLEKGWVNPYAFFTRARVWPRGLPLTYVNSTLRSLPDLGDPRTVSAPVQQYLADRDPDVDAIFRLINDDETWFEKRPVPLAIGDGAMTPFNSQNTAWWPWAYPLMYLPAFVSIRMTDIWRGLIAVRCLAAGQKHLGFGNATVVQDRNEHALMRDFQDELPGYLRNEEIVDTLDALQLDESADAVSDNLRRCYRALNGIDVMPDEELALLETWLAEVADAVAASASA